LCAAQHFPPASSSRDTYTLLKFYNLSAQLIRSVLQVWLPAALSILRSQGVPPYLGWDLA
jgi:hypothetical protein